MSQSLVFRHSLLFVLLLPCVSRHSASCEKRYGKEVNMHIYLPAVNFLISQLQSRANKQSMLQQPDWVRLQRHIRRRSQCGQAAGTTSPHRHRAQMDRFSVSDFLLLPLSRPLFQLSGFVLREMKCDDQLR